MSFSTDDQSVQNSQIEELIEFEYNPKNATFHTFYRVTSAAYPIVHDGKTFKPLAGIRSGNIQSTIEPGKNVMKIEGIPRTNEYFSRHLFSTRTHETIVRIYHVQPTGYALAWTGKISSVTRPEGQGIMIMCNPISTMAKKPVSCGGYSVQCTHKLFSRRCGVDRATWSRSGTITAISGNTVQSSAFSTEADGFFTGGELTVNQEVKTIVGHAGDTVTLLDAFYSDDAQAGDSFDATAGCAHTIDECDSRFNNKENCGSCPHIPDANDIQNGNKGFTY